VRQSRLGISVTNWPIVSAPDDMWWWVWRSRWIENWQGKPKYSEKSCFSATLFTTNTTWLDLGSNPAAVGSRKLTTWTMARPTKEMTKSSEGFLIIQTEFSIRKRDVGNFLVPDQFQIFIGRFVPTTSYSSTVFRILQSGELQLRRLVISYPTSELKYVALRRIHSHTPLLEVVSSTTSKRTQRPQGPN
jgi:hypothetical protein